MSRKHPITKSFKFAFKGFFECAQKEPNFKIHLVLGAAALALGYFFQINLLEWVALVLAIGFVLFAELVNTAMEAMVNILSPEKREQARIAKDTSSAAVLVAAVASIFVGAAIFLPKVF